MECALLDRRRMRIPHRALAIVTLVVVASASTAHARRPRKRPTPLPTPVVQANVHLAPAGTIPLPGRGLALAWAPDGSAIAAGGHFKDRATGQRYDTRIADVPSLRLRTASFDCHYWWVVALAWDDNPFVGPVIADGAGDHAVKLWNADGPGGTRCKPGQFRAADGGLQALYDVNGWVTSLVFSPDGRWLAATSRDRTVRIWQVAPGPDQWKVVKLWYDPAAGNYLSVRWSPDGRGLAAGDRRGRAREWAFDPDRDRWDPAMIASFAKLGWKQHPGFFKANAAALLPVPLWTDGGHKQVWNVRYAPDGGRVAIAGADGLSVLASGSGSVVYRRATPGLYGLDWSPDGAYLAAGAADHRIYVFRAADGARFDRLEGHAERVTAVAFAPDGRTLASTAGGPLLQYALNAIVQGPDDAIHLWRWR
jgi:WD40 repeat protein